MSALDKIDLFKMNRADYTSPKKPILVETKPTTYMAITGTGKPGGDEFQGCIGALYGMAYTVKMTLKFNGRIDYTICKLEAQWWCGDDDPDIGKVSPEQWRWRLMIRTPETVKRSDLELAAEKLESKGKGAFVQDVCLQKIAEGLCVQMLHVGPYDNEPETVAVMTAFADEKGYRPTGMHHEIYLSDPRRVPPERLKTILRLPVS